MKEFLQFKKIWLISPTIQIFVMIIFFVFIAILGKLCLIKTSLLFGRPNSFYIETLFAPIYEEIIFRGIIFGVLLKHFSTIKAIALSSLFFGLWHLKNIFFIDTIEVIKQMAYTGLVFGPILAFITLKTKTIWIPTIIHYANNTLAFVIIYNTTT